ncbi:MAG: hydrogenase [Methanobacteriaceae archaeon]|jgi:hypothetical protein|nr:MAG: hydrogenase [Methanobacterium sp. BRmetb2]MCC7557959.1 hydrogenase [Methanobacteriaceae archaeon]
MEEEKDTIFMMALVAAGVILVSGLAGLLQWFIVIPVTIAGFLLTLLIGTLYREGSIKLSENLEKWAMIIILAMIIFSFIILYKPA